MKLGDIKGLKEKRIQKLNEAGIFCPEDLILHFPFQYYDALTEPKFVDGENVLFSGVVIEPAKRQFIRRGLSVVKAKLQVKNVGVVTATWFNQPFIVNSLTTDKEVLLSGKVKKRGSFIEISSPSIYKLRDNDSEDSIVPIYRPIKGLPYNILVDGIKTVLSNIKISGFLTEDACEKFGIIPLDEAIRTLHFPSDMNKVRAASKSVAVEHLSYNVSVFNVSRSLKGGQRTFFYDENSQKLEQFMLSLPFELTLDQKKAVSALIKDFHSSERTNRLIQGDVGCGKTIIALIAMYYAALSGYQSVLMSPTEILARQHYQTAINTFKNTDIRLEYLSGSQSKQARDNSLFNIKQRNADIIIGTHSLIFKTVEFNKLSLIITDEQQRFGVAQRANLENKSIGADTIVMTATPIPRTLGLTFYGDLEQTIIKTMPKNRPKISTHLVKERKLEDMYSYIKTCADKDLLTYVVCPRIEDEDDELTSVKKMYEELKKRFPDDYIGLLHGQMKEKDKNAIMEAFSLGKIKVLLSTTVVEVGIDVKNAINMVIFDPDRYGLSQLHQLRGRVGRGTVDSYCFLIDNGLSSESRKRLEYFVECRDGFELAEYDFKLRGAGDFLGTRQHGQAVLLAGEVLTGELIAKAKKLSDYLLSLPETRSILIKNIDENKLQYIKNITLN